MPNSIEICRGGSIETGEIRSSSFTRHIDTENENDFSPRSARLRSKDYLNMDEDDLPPSLDSLAEQVAGVALNPSDERVATVTAVTHAPSTAVKKATPGGGFKKGFFDAPKPKKSAVGGEGAAASSKKEDAIPFIRADRGSSASAVPSTSKSDHINVKPGQAKAIPEFLKVEPDVRALHTEEAKKKIVEAMKPTEQLLGRITSNQSLLSGFDDPEVMKAVAEVAENPAAFAKYKDNKKVLAFYQSMAGVVGDRLSELGDHEDKKKVGSSGVSTASTGGKSATAPQPAKQPPPPAPSNIPASFIVSQQDAPQPPPAKKKGVLIEEID